MSLRRHLPHYLMIAPFMVLFAAFFLYPILSGFYYSFHDWNGVKTPEFVGFGNYAGRAGRAAPGQRACRIPLGG